MLIHTSPLSRTSATYPLPTQIAVLVQASAGQPHAVTRLETTGRFAIDAAAFVTQSETMEACFQDWT